MIDIRTLAEILFMGFLCMSAVLYTFWHKSGYKNVHATVQNYELLVLFVCLKNFELSYCIGERNLV